MEKNAKQPKAGIGNWAVDKKKRIKKGRVKINGWKGVANFFENSQLDRGINDAKMGISFELSKTTQYLISIVSTFDEN